MAARWRRDELRRRRTVSSAAGPTRSERRTGEDRNRSRRGRRISPRKELKGVSPEEENRRQLDLGEGDGGGGNGAAGARVWDKGGRADFKGREAGDRCDGEGGRRGGQWAGSENSRRRDCGRRRTKAEPRYGNSTRESPTAQPALHLVKTQPASTR
jgi:hypothetical protein